MNWNPHARFWIVLLNPSAFSICYEVTDNTSHICRIPITGTTGEIRSGLPTADLRHADARHGVPANCIGTVGVSV